VEVLAGPCVRPCRGRKHHEGVAVTSRHGKHID
jgi:hypothetical protein